MDLLMEGGAWQPFKSSKIAKYWLVCFLAVYNSPGNLLYKMLITPRHPVRLIAIGLDEIDSISSVAGAIDKARELHPSNPLAPLLAGVLMQRSGALFRYYEAKGRELKANFPYAKIDNAMRLALFNVVCYWTLITSGVRRVTARRWLTVFTIFSSSLKEMCDFDLLTVLKEK